MTLGRLGRGVGCLSKGRCSRSARDLLRGSYSVSSAMEDCRRRLRSVPRTGLSGERHDGLNARVGRLCGCDGGVHRCRSSLRVLNGEGDFSGASGSTAFVHLGRSTVGGKRAGPTCGLRVTARGRCVAGFSLCSGPASALAFGPFVRGFG